MEWKIPIISYFFYFDGFLKAELRQWVGYIRTWSGLHNMARQEGQQAVETIINKFLLQCQQILAVSEEELMAVNIILRTQYWITLYQK